MDIFGKDTVVSIPDMQMFGLRLQFKKGKVLSPNDVFDKVKDLTKKHDKKMRETVGRIGDLLVGSHRDPFASFAFSMGWYFRKAVESLEKKHGTCEIQFEDEKVDKDAMVNYIGTAMKRDAEKLSTFANELIAGDIPKDLFGEENEG